MPSISKIEIIGHNYETPVIIRLSDGEFISRKGGILWTKNIAYDAYALHVGRQIPPIPANTKLIINYCFQNFYGVYVNCTYGGYDYDIDTDNLTYLNKTLTEN